MPQVVIHAYLEFADEATRDEAVRLTGPIQWKTRTEEPGCLEYCFAADPCVPNRVTVHDCGRTMPRSSRISSIPIMRRCAMRLSGWGRRRRGTGCTK